MTVPPFSSLDGLADLGSRSGIDIRPTLLRVLTDLYIQKPAHTADEDRQYTELAMRLMEAVDVATRATVASRLATHPAPPQQVLSRLRRGLPQSWLQEPRLAQTPTSRPNTIAAALAASRAIAGAEALAARPPQTQPGAPAAFSVAQASELNALFFGADADERRLILLNLEVIGLPARRQPLARDPQACQRLEAAALAHNTAEFVFHLARSLHISQEQALRIVEDESGEPIVVAAKVLNMPDEMLARILLFLHPKVGRSVERVLVLARLYGDIPPLAAEHMLALWQALSPLERVTPAHQPLLRDDVHRSHRRASALPNRAGAASPPGAERRSAS